MLIQARWLTATPSRALDTYGARAHPIAGSNSVWLVATSSLRLRTSAKTPGSVARGGLVREIARGVPQVAISPRSLLAIRWFSRLRLAVFIPGGQACMRLASNRVLGCLGQTLAAWRALARLGRACMVLKVRRISLCQRPSRHRSCGLWSAWVRCRVSSDTRSSRHC